MDVDPIRRRFAPIVTVLLVAVLCAGCGPFVVEDDQSTCGDQDWCPRDSEGGYTDGAYDPSISGLYCQVAEIRERFRDDNLDAGDLPPWAETRQRDGAPIVIDLATIPMRDVDRRQDDLRSHLEDLGQPLDYDEMGACQDDLTQRDVEATDGKRQVG